MPQTPVISERFNAYSVFCSLKKFRNSVRSSDRHLYKAAIQFGMLCFLVADYADPRIVSFLSIVCCNVIRTRIR
ncbi:hypothetical protein MPL3356_100008 [Mesorhizobium plurifarium]|uniref:Uncharacterized protein n=1 Tax=Mesorhizobium plurifarium TaxID=69974 RepID=A0A090D9B7_MESPL|nr:hypothetical protein MPL3356_100008 [Mesorhizobium plurifarium]